MKNGVVAFAVPVHLALKFESANAGFLSILIVASDKRIHFVSIAAHNLIAARQLAKTVAGVWIYQICAVSLTLLGFMFVLIV